LSAECLSNRSIVRVSGSDAVDYLQGLITNDMKHLSDDPVSTKEGRQHLRAMYCMFLDARGRVILDSIIYRVLTKNKNDELTDIFYVECDSEMSATLLKHLKLYKLRKRVDISQISDELDVWVKFCPDVAESERASSYLFEEIKSQGSLAFRDPRLHSLGVRILCPKGDFNKTANVQILESGHYRVHRYRLGVGEGMNDIPPGNSFPLEANCDYLHGVSFHKGCYVGQELTARTHHTGVVRKRLMPLSLPNSFVQMSEASIVDTSTSKVVGKLRGVTDVGGKCVGLGLLRVAEVLRAPSLKLGESEVKTEKPFWWPEEAPKELKSKGSS
ncbi:putative transferase CAF17 homolog, mitochondrial, partial [Hetaerina americana]|uniref:putative transferase CAF17 homolog, mitochondrial n=1 Tax=Hetaerina americana TaxID=62018 RepID=UPI003A7F1132